MNTVSQKEKITRGQAGELVDKLELAGLDKEFAQLIIGEKGNKLAEKIVELVRAYSTAIGLREYCVTNDGVDKNKPLVFINDEAGKFYHRK